MHRQRLIRPAHFGFVKGGRANSPLRILTSLKEQAKECPLGRIFPAAVLDLCSAFDCTNQRFLEPSLTRIGAPRKFCHWIRALLNGQRRIISISGNAERSTEPFEVSGGLPQGDGLSPILFVIYLDMIIEGMMRDNEEGGAILGADTIVQALLYGDDLSVFGKSHPDFGGLLKGSAQPQPSWEIRSTAENLFMCAHREPPAR